MGWRNADVEFTDKQLLDNIKKMQVDGNIPQSKLLVKQDGLGACSLDIEMETTVVRLLCEPDQTAVRMSVPLWV